MRKQQPGLGVQAEWVIGHLESQLEIGTDFSVYRTPGSPGYYFGNVLALHGSLADKSRFEWEALFDCVFSDQPDIQHRTFVWTPDATPGERALIADFIGAGYDLEETHVLTLLPGNLIAPKSPNKKVTIRPFSTAKDWQQWNSIQMQERRQEHEEADYRVFLAGRENAYKALEEAGCGHFFGAFSGEDLVGYAGVFHHQRLARYQQVRVVDSWQGQGVARTLMAQMAHWVTPYADTQIIIADAHYHATQLYQSLGFRIREQESSLCWWPKLRT